MVTILTVLEVLYVVALTTWILFEKRPPISTIAWIVALVGLPYVGFVVFFFFGPRRLERKRLNLARARGRAREGAAHHQGHLARRERQGCSEAEDPRVLQLERLAVGSGEPHIDVCEDVTIFDDADATFDAIVAAVAAARHHVHVGYYIFESGVVCTRLVDALVDAAKRGVTVRVLVDHLGSLGLGRGEIRAMRASGIKFARFNPVRLARFRSRINFRNHRKIVVCDGTVGFTGGMNVCDVYVASPAASGPPERRQDRARRGHELPWRDTHVRLTGDAVRWLQLTFLDDWHFTTTYLARDPEYFPPPTGSGAHRVQILASGPDRMWGPIARVYFAAIAMSHTRVLVTTPYFVPDSAMLAALKTAALRGVDVRVLVPRRSDSLIVTAATRSYYDDLLAAGARIFEYEPTMIHSKTLVVDDLLASIGTVNMDNRSFRLNFEVTALLYEKAHADAVAEQFRHDLQSAREIKLHARGRLPLQQRAAEAGARLLSPLL